MTTQENITTEIPTPSQTNLQFLNQLQAMDIPKDALKTLSHTCDFMGELVAGGYRASGRPFYNHLIGVASLTALESRDIKLISAALLHSIYEFGRFPGRLLPPNLTRRRQMIATRVGTDVEEIIYSFHMADWPQKFDPENLSNLSDQEKNLLLLKLADILEDLLEDMGPVRTGKITLWPLHKLEDPIDHLIRISNGIGAEKLASLFAETSNHKSLKIIEKKTRKTYFHTPLNVVFPYALKAKLKRFFRR